ncbi:MAG: 3-dehydroquinate synthase [Leptospiraceae bacterium]|nr:3-dehydroquinate synthase [Leptospiraceae bacterium]MDW7974962.1 3-dehydroquinate synthase [Leptospiraceae bacterium]
MNYRELWIPLKETVDKSYYIYLSDKIEEYWLQQLKKKQYTKHVIITDENVYQCYKKTIEFFEDSLGEIHTIIRPAGEEYKHISYLQEVFEELLSANVDRKSCIIAFGGGVIGDFAGFVASTYQRGIDYYQIPTTLLAMVDSSVGGKVAVNLNIGKNIVGSFYQPQAVFCNIEFLKTLPEKEWICGLAEMLKHSLLDPNVYENFRVQVKNQPNYREWDKERWFQMIFESIQVKARVVSKDEKETGLRSILNLGHTVGHAIESYTHYKALNHGEAVSRGLVFSLLLSNEKWGLGDEIINEVFDLMKLLKLPMDTYNISSEELIPHLFYDKKNQGGKVKEVYLKEIGEPIYNQELSLDNFRNTWQRQKQLFG